MFTYSEKLGFDDNARRARLHLLGLGNSDHALAAYTQEKVIAPNIDFIVPQLYRILHQDKQFLEIISRGYELEKLEETFREYLQTLGVGFDTPEYFESRLRIGMTHIWIGLGLGLYQCANRIVQQLLIDAIPQESSKRDVLIAHILKVTTLDMSLAVEAYHGAQVDGLRESLSTRQQRNEQLVVRVCHDALTGVMARDTLMQAIDIAREQLHNEDTPYCLIMFDFDHFKKINDTYGHIAGDQVLKEVARRVRTALRSGDLLGRYGGEEFIILLEGADQKLGFEVAERVRRKVADYPVKTEHGEIVVTISLGFAQAQPDEGISHLIDRADHALYQAKTLGRNRVEVDDVAGD